MSEQLKPCPFCGGDKLHVVNNSWVKCDNINCGARGPMNGETCTDSINQWNHRAALESKPPKKRKCHTCLYFQDQECVYPAHCVDFGSYVEAKPEPAIDRLRSIMSIDCEPVGNDLADAILELDSRLREVGK